MNTSTTSWSDTQKLLAFVVVIAFILVIGIWMFHPPATDAASTGVLNTLVGTLGGFSGMVVTFYFGSSRGERTKDTTIAGLTTPPTSTTTTNGNGTTTTTTDHAAPATPTAG